MGWIKTKVAVPRTEYDPRVEGAYYLISEDVFCYAPFSSRDGEDPSIKVMPAKATFVQSPEGDHWVCWSINGDSSSDETFDVDEIKEWMPFPKKSEELNSNQN